MGMTNGEKIKEIFPSTDSRLDEKTGIMLVKWVDGATKCFKADWWNAKYKEPRKGHWLTHKEYCDKNNLLPSGYGSYYWCSECGCGIDSSAFHQGRYDYCPTCGAKMAEVR